MISYYACCFVTKFGMLEFLSSSLYLFIRASNADIDFTCIPASMSWYTGQNSHDIVE